MKANVTGRFFYYFFLAIFSLSLFSCKPQLNDPQLVLNSISPESGSSLGGTTITLSGNSLKTVTAVSIGGIPCNISSSNLSTLQCVTAQAPAGMADVTATTQNGQKVTLTNAYTYLGGPTINSISPAMGTISGGTFITISGEGFMSGATISFGEFACLQPTFVSSTVLTCITPVHGEGYSDLTVTNPDTQYGIGTSLYYFRGSPTVTSVSPVGGSLGGNTRVTVNGSGFYSGISVLFGTASCFSVSVISDTMLTCTTSSNNAGAVKVKVTNMDSQSGESTSTLYTYQNPPTLVSVSPVEGPIGGGTPVTLSGLNFTTNGATVTLGGKPCTSTLVTSSTNISCVTPLQLLTGVVDILVTNSDGQSSLLPSGYSYNLTPTISSISPSSGFASGGTFVTILGSSFRAGATVTIGGVDCLGVTVNSASSITCTTSSHSAGSASVVVRNTDSQSATFSSAFTFLAAPTVASVDAPHAGPIVGGSSIVIKGSGFRAGASVLLGTSSCTNVSVLSDTAIRCTTPSHAAGDVNVTVTNSDTQSAVSATTLFTFQTGPRITAITPAIGPAIGGQTVTLTGTGFTTGATIEIGGSTCSTPLFIDSTSVSCTTPVKSAGIYSVKIINNDGQSDLNGNAYTFLPPPEVTTVAASAGALGGGTSVTITGKYFLPGDTVYFDTVSSPCTVATITSTTISCVTSAHTQGSVAVTVVDTYGQSGSKANLYTYEPAPVITSVTKNAGAIGGNTRVTVAGSNFLTNAVITFGGSNCTNVVYTSSNSITCSTPSHAAGTVDVVVTNPDSQSVTSTAAYTYEVAPSVSYLSPASGVIAGGTAVTINGANFINGATVDLSGSSCNSVAYISPTQLTCTTSAHASGVVTVKVTNPDDQYGVQNIGYIYIAPPTIQSISPNGGPPNAATSITIAGTGFVSGDTVTIGGSSCTSLVVNSATAITCTSPLKTAGSYDVIITDSYGQSTTLTNGFTYRSPPTVASISPTAGALSGGTLLTITGTGFITGATANICASTSFISATSLSCITKSNAAGTVAVTVTNPDTQTGTLPSAYTFQAAPTVTSISRAAGALSGGTSLTITGTGFITGATVNICASTSFTSATSLTCTTSAHAAGTYDVIVTNSDNQTGTLTQAYTFQAAPSISSISPLTGTTSGGTTLTIIGSGFLSAATVNICSSTTYVSATSLSCITASHAAGTASVTVTNLDVQVSNSNSFTYQNEALLAWASTPSPDYGSTSTNSTLSFVLNNIGNAISSAVTISKTGGTPAGWQIGTDGCSNTTLAATTGSCTIQVTFLGALLPSGSYTTTLTATATSGGTTSIILTGTVP